MTFDDYYPDPADADCLRRAVSKRADHLTFEDGHVVLWFVGAEVGRYPLQTITSISIPGAEDGRRRDDSEAIRKQFPNAYQPWSPEDDDQLLALYRGGSRDFDDLGQTFGRQPSAIRSRLAKLGLEQLSSAPQTKVAAHRAK
ncbi:hypothetical protein AB0A66_31360 [Streptomyces longwoodensis]|uniref:hypothetical protein n=1 Tax=Streptomyces longwoodensis TaxID=68231 RepID=UPI0033D132BC